MSAMTWVGAGLLLWLLLVLVVVAVVSGNHGSWPQVPRQPAAPPHDPASCLNCRRQLCGDSTAPGIGPGPAAAVHQAGTSADRHAPP